MDTRKDWCAYIFVKTALNRQKAKQTDERTTLNRQTVEQAGEFIAEVWARLEQAPRGVARKP